MKKDQEFYLGWLYFSDAYFKKMILATDRFQEYLQEENPQGLKSVLNDEKDFKSDDHRSLNGNNGLGKKTQAESNFFTLRSRKKKGTINPIVSAATVCLIVCLLLISLMVDRIVAYSSSLIKRLTDFTITIQTNSIVQTQLNSLFITIQETANDPAGRFLGRPPLVVMKLQHTNVMSGFGNFLRNQTLNLNLDQKATDYIKQVFFGNACSRFKDLAYIIKEHDTEKDLKLDCETFGKGILTKGLFHAIDEYIRIAQNLAAKVTYYVENQNSPPLTEDTGCPMQPALP